jgi:type II secretory ATPase GspE/PulE/Tfp pilus assembly ATPase PilB-like protein
MKLDEKRKPQDGRFEATIIKKHIDFRVSTFPTFFGEKVVLRILDPEKGLRTLEEVGLSGRNLKVVKDGIKRPYGMVLLTGPTGSGKTTTLYAMLQLLDKERFNVVSLEDPIEYNVEGINQSQVRPEIEYTFANGLRSILRQDPDMIMVGEIRDKETARLAVQAALTGHLVFSTLHTNNALGVIPRLIDMEIDPYLIAPTLILAIAQRLVRTLCEDSRRELPVTGKVKETIETEFGAVAEEAREDLVIPKNVYQAAPSSVCPRGTRGRTGVFEVLSMTPELENIILTEPSEAAIVKEAERQGMITMKQDGILKVLKGHVGLEQLSEVI